MRPRNPGERPWTGIMEPRAVHDRTITAIVDNVSQNNGYVTLDFDGLPSVGRPATIPWLWASFPEPGIGAWGRYMPFKGDVMKVSFDFDNTPHVVGYDTKASDPSVADGKSGWPRITAAGENGSLPHFAPLASGEYDFMSSGGAYIRGTNTGQLMLIAGSAHIIITGGISNTVDMLCNQYTISSVTNKIRYGQVRRALPGMPGEVAGIPTALWNTDGSLSELDVRINRSISALNTPMARLALGSVTSEAGAQETSHSGALRRFIVDISDPAGQESVCSIELDNTGNVYFSGRDCSISTNTVKLGVIPDGGVMNGTAFAEPMSLAFDVLEGALSAAEGLSGAPTVPGAALAALAQAIEVFMTQFKQAITTATSQTVQVQR